MIRADALNSHFDPVITEMTDTQQIQILRVCDSDKSKSKEIIADEIYKQERIRKCYCQ